jgi:hypothetical protein
VFDTDGTFIRESQHPRTPCGLFMSADQYIWLAHGHTGQIMKTRSRREGSGKDDRGWPGQGAREMRRAHYIAVSPRDEIFMAETLNWRVAVHSKKVDAAKARHRSSSP